MDDERWRGALSGTAHQVSARPSRRDQLLARWATGAFRWIGLPLGILAFCAAGTAQNSPLIVPVRVDHHVHLNSPSIQAFLPEFCASMRRFGGCDPTLTAPHLVQDLLAEMGRVGIQRALVLSDGYLAESPIMEPQRPDAAEGEQAFWPRTGEQNNRSARGPRPSDLLVVIITAIAITRPQLFAR